MLITIVVYSPGLELIIEKQIVPVIQQLHARQDFLKSALQFKVILPTSVPAWLVFHEIQKMEDLLSKFHTKCVWQMALHFHDLYHHNHL
jgi:hypothetical protein